MFSRIGITLALVVCFLALPGLAGTADAYGFSADRYSYNGTETVQGKIYFGLDKVRNETAGTATILRFDKQLAWLLMPYQKMYMEQTFRPETVVVSSSTKAPGEVERVLLGRETVNGYLCDKYRLTTENYGRRNSILIWLMVDGGWPVKTAAEDGRWRQEFRNIRLGEPDDALFEVPASYQKFSMSIN